MKKYLKNTIIAVVCILTMALCAVMSSAADDEGTWVAAWGTGPTNISLQDNIAFMGSDVSARTVISPTASGSMIRIKFTNYYGVSDVGLTLDKVTIAKSTASSAIDPDGVSSAIDVDSIRPVTFNKGHSKVNIPKGEEVYSDPIYFDVNAFENLAITMYSKGSIEIRTMGLSGGSTYLALGDKTYEKNFGLAGLLGDENENVYNLMQAIISAFRPNIDLDIPLSYGIVSVVPCIATVDVLTEGEGGYSVAVVGDSTVSNSFPEYLAQQIAACGVDNVGVMGKGVIGNMLCGQETNLVKNIYGQPLVERFENDIVKQTNVKYVVVKIGANDIIHPVCENNLGEVPQPTAQELIEGMKNICNQAHKMGAKVILCTITQWKGTKRDYIGTGATYVRTAEEEEADWQIANTVNKWITDSSNTYHDGYVDLVSVSGPLEGNELFGYYYPDYTQDGIHPNDELQKIWAQSFPLSLIGIEKRVGNIKLNMGSKSLYCGESFDLNVTKIIPDDAADKSVEWSTSNSDVASIVLTADGVKVTAKKGGTATIYCKALDGSGTVASCKVTVNTKVTSITISSTAQSIYTKRTCQLSAAVSPSNATDKTVTWSSSNSKIATVSSKGLVTGVGSGTVTITCKSNDGAAKATYKITVVKPIDVTSVTLNASSKSLYKGATYQLKATVSPSNATFPQVAWKSSDTKVATVSKTGLVTAVSAGTAYITCTSTDNPSAFARVKITVKIKTTGVKLNKTAMSIYQTASETLKATVSPSNATDKKVTWKSSDTRIATVDKNGVVKGIKPGKAVITCTTANGGYTAKCTVQIKKIVKTKSVSFKKDSYSMKDGKTLKLSPVVTPSNASLKDTFIWKSSNTKVATVNANGVITAKKPGTVTITCKTIDTGKTDTCKVTVKKVSVSSVSLNRKSLTLQRGKSYQLSASVLPENATDKRVTWTSSNTTVAVVSSSGKVTAKIGGKTIITCTTKDGKKVAVCTVTVPGIKVSSIELSNESVRIAKGNTATLKATVAPSNAANKAVKWSSSNTKVAKVDANGKITAVGKGTATITCTAADGSGVKAQCKVEVYTVSAMYVVLSKSSLTMQKGATYQLKATIIPSNASVKTVKWTSSDTSVATVNAYGVVTAKGTGTCRIKAVCTDNSSGSNPIAYCNITVK